MSPTLSRFGTGRETYSSPAAPPRAASASRRSPPSSRRRRGRGRPSHCRSRRVLHVRAGEADAQRGERDEEQSGRELAAPLASARDRSRARRRSCTAPRTASAALVARRQSTIASGTTSSDRSRIRCAERHRAARRRGRPGRRRGPRRRSGGVATDRAAPASGVHALRDRRRERRARRTAARHRIEGDRVRRAGEPLAARRSARRNGGCPGRTGISVISGSVGFPGG